MNYETLPELQAECSAFGIPSISAGVIEGRWHAMIQINGPAFFHGVATGSDLASAIRGALADLRREATRRAMIAVAR